MRHTARLVLAALAVALAAAAPAHAAPGAPTNLGVADLVADPGVYDPQFSWSPVSGAVGYEIEVNSTDYWAAGSKVCCDLISLSAKVTTYGVAYSPPVVLANNTYFWRVRAVDVGGNAGPWAAGPSFAKTFGNDPSIDGLKLVDLELVELPVGSSTAAPLVRWNPAPGASSYQVGVAPFGGGTCDWAATISVRWDKRTATTAWTPLGWSRAANADPLATGPQPVDDLSTHLDQGQEYCVRVRPVDRASTTGGPEIVSEWTYLPSNNAPAFSWSGPAPGGECVPCVPQASDYLRPLSGSTVGAMPVFTWNPVPGAQSYFVVVARDASFTTIVDYAWTKVTAYAPRTASATKGYADETSGYHWVILPAASANGQGVSADVVTSNARPFVKQATPPALQGPSDGAVLTSAATVFHWSPVVGARRYRLQVSEDPTFVNVFKEGGQSGGAVTDSTAYTSSTSYPVGTTLYWRVQAEAENGSSYVGLRWSATGSFKRSGTVSTGANNRFKVAAKGYPVRNRYRTITLTVRNRATNAPVAAASVRVSGGGVKVVTKKTTSLGKVTFRLRATKYPGLVTYKVTKSGFQVLSYIQSVRRV